MTISLFGKANSFCREEDRLRGDPLPLQEKAEVSLQADFLQVRAALAQLGWYCAARRMEPAIWHRLEIAVAEALNNAVEHGCHGVPAREAAVTLRWTWGGPWIEVEVVDPGLYLPVHPPLLPREAAATAERGRGSFLMHQSVDHVLHELRPEGHAVILRKQVGYSIPDPSPTEAEAALEGMADDLAHCYESIAALYYFAERLATAPSFQELADGGLRRLRELVGARHLHLRLLDEAGGELDLAGAEFAAAHTPQRLDPFAEGVEWRVVRENLEATVEDCAALAPGDPLRAPGSMAFCTPVFFQHEVLGVLCAEAEPTAARGYFTAGELGLIRVVADFLGIARRNAALQRQREAQQRTVRDLEIATEIQHALLPSAFPPHRRFGIFGLSRSALEVGGDTFDAVRLPEGGTLLVIADVMGKGLPAALLATIFRTAVQARMDLAARPADLLNQVNRQIVADLSRLQMFITAQVAWLSPDGGRLELASAGHCPALRINRNRDRIDRLWSEGIPLGIMGDALIESRTFLLAPGDTVLFMTDGIYEVRNGAGQLLDFEGVMQYLLLHGPGGAEELCRDLLGFVRLYAEGQPPADDQTLLALAPLAATAR